MPPLHCLKIMVFFNQWYKPWCNSLSLYIYIELKLLLVTTHQQQISCGIDVQWPHLFPGVDCIQYISFKEFTFSPPPPLKKRGSYCFARRSVCRPRDVRSTAQYFFIHLLESCQLGTLIGCPRVDAPYLFSGHKDKGQRQTVGHCTNDVRSIF